jgi:hypothetical protein
MCVAPWFELRQVGYAFVNFTSVNALYEFIQAKVGKKWNMFSSEKVLQVGVKSMLSSCRCPMRTFSK